jgi:hypothetical protein
VKQLDHLEKDHSPMQIWASDQPYVAGNDVYLPLFLSPSRGTIFFSPIWEMCAHVRGVESSMSCKAVGSMQLI